MKYNKQNEKIELITDDFLVIGIDVGSETHFARAFNNRNVEYSKKPYAFNNTAEGFRAFESWAVGIAKEHKKKYFITGMEPTGHYWFNLGDYIRSHGMILVHVNTAAVKKAKEIDDNDPKKSDPKDPKTIAGLVNRGSYSFPYIPEGIYAEIRELMNQRGRVNSEMTAVKNRLARWFSIYFPEFQEVYKHTDSKTGMMILKEYPLPSDIVKLGVEGIVKVWRDNKVRGAGQKRAQKLYDAAKKSIGRTEASKAVRMEFVNLISDLSRCGERMDQIMEMVEELLAEVPNAEKLLKIKGVGIVTAMMFIAEVGDISRFNDPKEIQKLGGLSIVENSSGKHQGQYSISYRGRKRLRYALFELAISLIGRNEEFASLHEYYTKREKNPLKKLQSVIAVSCKVIRVFFKILKDGVEYDPIRMAQDIKRISPAQ